MDLDEEGRTGFGFWGPGRREWDGRWTKKKDGEQKSSLLNSICYGEIESKRLELLVF